MSGGGSVYQTVIFSVQKTLDETGQFPEEIADIAAVTGIAEKDIRALFGTKAALHEAMIYQAVTLLNDSLRAGVIASPSDDPITQLHSIAHSYVIWAQDNPGLFRLLVTALNGQIEPDSTLHRYTTSMRDLYHRKFAEAQARGILAPDMDIEITMMMLHCLTKGGNMMFLTRNTDPWFDGDTRPTAELAERIFVQFMQNLVRANRACPQQVA
ncbi:hypothetical protein [Paracoccus sp. (in: a-proteobacteria)]|uniref:TetR/AcrR family transcriptional regulator n=1 Tax=Paracoccus sp. TaxID=267 RepID=UPI00321FD020